MTATNHYYTEHAQDFFDSTVKVDIGKLYQRFLPRIPENGAILDAGCGSGRDSKNFLELGYDVTAFDANRSLVQLASEHMGQEVLHSTFQTFDAGTSTFDGIWACASLLHVTTEELPTVFTNLSRFLKSGGILYCSFKYGDVELVRNGRYFTDLNEQRLQNMLFGSNFAIDETWVSSDARPGRETEKWLNAILVKVSP